MSALSPWNVALIRVGRHRKKGSVYRQGPESSVNVTQHQLDNSVVWESKNSCCIWVRLLQFYCYSECRIWPLKTRPLKYGAWAAGFDGNGPVWSVKAISRKTRVLISVSSPHYPTPFPAESHTEPKAGAFKVRRERTHQRTHTHIHANTYLIQTWFNVSVADWRLTLQPHTRLEALNIPTAHLTLLSV